MKKKVIKLVLFLIFYLYGFSALSAEIKSYFNNSILNDRNEVKEFSFLAAGHIYGSHNNPLYPAASLLANIPVLNDSGADFMVLLGDVVQHSNNLNIRLLKNGFTSKLNFPIFNAPGNHDLLNRTLYIDNFGETFFSFQYSTSFFIFLDSVIDQGRIEGEQLKFVTKKIDYCKESPQVKNIFIFSHHLLWAIGNYPYSDIIPFTNGRKGDHPKDATTISHIILPELKCLTDKNVYFVSGDIGCDWSLPFFYAKDNNPNITYLATGLGDTEKDMILKINVNEFGAVTFQLISLTAQKLNPVQDYNLNYWKNYFGDKRRIFNKVERVVRHKYFLSGALSSLFLLICFYIVVRLTMMVKKDRRHSG